MHLSAVTTFALGFQACCALAANSTKPQPQIATFDDLNTTKGIPAIYQGLEWSFDLSSSGSNVAPNTAPNVATFGPGSQLKGKTATISVTSTTKSFDLISFFFACTQWPVGIAEGCSIAVTAYDSTGSMVGTAPLVFAVTVAQETSGKVPMYKAVLPESYRELQNATVLVAGSETLAFLTTLVLDTVEHVNYF